MLPPVAKEAWLLNLDPEQVGGISRQQESCLQCRLQQLPPTALVQEDLTQLKPFGHLGANSTGVSPRFRAGQRSYTVKDGFENGGSQL